MNTDYDKKILICEKLGAKKFQKFVLNFDYIKWKIIKRLLPNYVKIADGFIDKQKNKYIKKAKNQNEIDMILKKCTYQKMLLRKEYNKGENINYHIASKPSEFMIYLNWNKSVHKRGLVLDAIAIPTFIALGIIGFPAGIPLALLTGIDSLKNFQCVNIQNYNIYRLKRIENKLKKKEATKEKIEMEKYYDAYEVIYNTLDEKKDIVSIDEILNNVNSKEQLIQLKKLIENEKKQRENKNYQGGKIKCI